jgi:hypothetical protein
VDIPQVAHRHVSRRGWIQRFGHAQRLAFWITWGVEILEMMRP